jgi:hypothetical protein
MKHFRIISQPVIVAPKADTEYGKRTEEIIIANEIEDFLRLEDWLDYDSENKWSMSEIEFKATIEKIKQNNCIYYTNEYGEYWRTNPLSEDGYALEAIKITIEEMTEIAIEEYNQKEKSKRKIAKEKRIKDKEDSDNAWFNLLNELGIDTICQGTVLEKFQEYRFPKKYKQNNN